MHTVLVAGLILTPLHAMAMLVADGWRSVRRPFRMSRQANQAAIARLGRGWRCAYRMNQVQRVYYRLGFAVGLACLAVAGVAELAHL
jgi:hypothetical protein